MFEQGLELFSKRSPSPGILLLPITDTIEDNQQNLQHDEYVVKRRPSSVLDEMLQLFQMQTIRSSYDNWVLKNLTLESPPETVDSKIISFTQFITDEDMSMSKVVEILCSFNFHLRMKFEDLARKGVKLRGNIQFVSSGNLSSCRVPFTYDFFIGCIKFLIYDQPSVKKVKNKPPDGLSVSINNARLCARIGKIMPGQPDENSCEDITINPESSYHTKIYDPLEDAVSTAIRNRIEKRLEQMVKSVFQPVSNKCLHPEKFFNEEMKNHYFRFESNHNTVGFPWLCDHHELIVGGLHHVKSLSVHYQPDGVIDFYKIDYEKLNIRWNTASVVLKRLDIETISNHIEASPMERNVTIKVVRVLEKKRDRIINLYEQSVIRELLQHGIAQMMKETLHWGTGFTDTIGGILKELNKKTLQNSFISFKAEVDENLNAGAPTFFKIQAEDFHLEITCTSGHLRISKLSYRKIRAQTELVYPLKKGNVLSIFITAEICLKEANFNISVHRNFNWTQLVQIDENLNETDTTITITSNHYHLQRKDRIEIGRRIIDDLIVKIRNQIINSAKSTFSPIFDACENSSISTIQPNPSGRQYSAVIRDYWTNTSALFLTNPIDMTVEGFGNFKSINVQCLHENVLVDGLRLENVTGSIKQIYDSNQIVIMNYSARYLTLFIKHTEKYVQVEFPEQSEYVFSKMPDNISLCDENTTALREKVQSTVASFIEKSFYYYDSYYRKRFRKAVENAMKKAITDDDQSQFDVSKTIDNKLASLLSQRRNWQNKFILKDKNYDNSFNQTEIPFESLNVTIDHSKRIMAKFIMPVHQEEICDFSGHFQGNYTAIRQQINLQGTLQIDILVDQISLLVPFIEKSDYTTIYFFDSIAHGFISSHEQRDITSQVDINEEHMQVLMHLTNTKSPLDNILMKKAYKQLIISRANRDPITFAFPRFCNIRNDFITDEERVTENHFYLINKAIDYTFDHFLTYYIKLYGLHHSESFRTSASKSRAKYEMTIRNITAEIIYSYYIGDLSSHVPKKLRVKIDKISLHCVVDHQSGELTFTDESQLQLSNEEKLSKLEKFKETLQSTILHEIQKSIEVQYYHNIRSWTMDP